MVASISRTAAPTAAVGTKARPMAMASARVPSTRAPTPEPGTMASRCPDRTSGPGECDTLVYNQGHKE